MNQAKIGSPTEALRFLVNSRFDTFLERETNPNITSSEKVAVSLFRSIFAHNPRNIRTALNRLDGILPKQVDIILPKVYMLYPKATPPKQLPTQETQIAVVDEPAPEQTTKTVPEMTIREATQELSRLPFSQVEAIIQEAAETAQWFSGKGPQPKHVPYLKSVIAAHLVVMATKAIPDVVEDFFDSVDGRLTETIKIGEDIYLTSYQTEAPPEALPNRDGILQIEATKIQDMWGKALQKGKKQYES